MDEFTRSYLQTAIWSSTDDNDRPLDSNYNYQDISPETMQVMVDDCDRFQTENFSDIVDDLDLAGHNFWLTRNGHGSGFWDGDYEIEAGKRLTDASHKFGSFDLYVGEGNRIYGS